VANKQSRWIVSRDLQNVLEADRSTVLNYLKQQDPFLIELQDGMRVGDLLIVEAPTHEQLHSHRDVAIHSFIRSLHRDVHGASEHASHQRFDQALAVLVHMRDRVSHFADRFAQEDQ
jgi:hypothetical protein